MKRATKRHKLLMLDIAVLIATTGLVAPTLISKALRNDAPIQCRAIGKDHNLVIKQGDFEYDTYRLTQCDTITLVNMDKDTAYQVYFGNHDSHLDYPGYTSYAIKYRESLKIDAFQAGSFRLHDHLKDKAATQVEIAPFK